MFKIVRFPSKLQGFFGSLKTEFHWDHFEYFRNLVLLVAFAWGRRNVAGLYRHLGFEDLAHRSRYNNFLLVERWDPAQALRRKAYELLAALKPQAGEWVHLILDDTKKGKRGREMEAVSWIHDPVSGRKIRGHQYVAVLIAFRGHTIPFGIRMYVKKEDAPALGVGFQKTTELAAELIGQFEPPAGVRVRVLFDNFYLCPVVVKACRQKGFRFVSTLKSNRNLFRNGRKLKAGAYGRKRFRRGRRKSLVLSKTRSTARYRYVDVGWIGVGDLGSLHVVFSQKNREPTVLGLVTDDPDLCAADLIRTYEARWAIEVFWKDAKSLLGLGQYQNVPYRAAVIHLHLVCFAYALLTHLALAGAGAKGQRQPAIHASTAELQNELRRIVWEDLADYLKRLSSGTSVVKELGRLLMAS